MRSLNNFELASISGAAVSVSSDVIGNLAILNIKVTDDSNYPFVATAYSSNELTMIRFFPDHRNVSMKMRQFPLLFNISL